MSIVYVTSMLLLSFDEDPLEQRLFDCIEIVFNISCIILLYGISDSIKRALQTQIRQEKVRQTTQMLIEHGSFRKDYGEANLTTQESSENAEEQRREYIFEERIQTG